MTEYILAGAGIAFAAAWQPGPLQAFLLSRIAVIGWRRTLPAALAPLISDGPIALLVLWALHKVPGSLESALQAVGGLVLLYFAWGALRQWRNRQEHAPATADSAPRTLWQTVLVNFVNPGPWLGWSLILGPLAIEAWRRSPAHAAGLVVAFYVTMTVNLAAFILLLGTTGFLGPAGRRGLQLATALVLAGLGVWRLLSALS